MALHPESAAVLAHPATSGGGEFTVQAARQARVRIHRALDPPPAPVAAVEQVHIPTDGSPVPATLCTPPGQLEGLLVYAHGGGWMHGSPQLAALVARALRWPADAWSSRGLPARTRTPVPGRAGVTSTPRCAGPASTPNGSACPARAVVVGGDSSGGNLAAACTLMARDHADPPLARQLLICPPLARNAATGSRRQFATGYGLTAERCQWNWRHYLAGQDPSHPYACPLLAADPKGLPPAALVTPEYDTLRDEAEHYARRLRAASVSVRHRRFNGMIHGFHAYAGVGPHRPVRLRMGRPRPAVHVHSRAVPGRAGPVSTCPRRH